MSRRRMVRTLLLMSALGILGCREPDRQPFLVEIPAGYKGWVSVRFFAGEACPEVPVEGGRPVLRVPQSGRACFGSPLGFGDVKDDYYYVDAAGRRTDIRDLVHREHVALEGASPNQKVYERFFVGTEEDLKNAPPEPKEE